MGEQPIRADWQEERIVFPHWYLKRRREMERVLVNRGALPHEISGIFALVAGNLTLVDEWGRITAFPSAGSVTKLWMASGQDMTRFGEMVLAASSLLDKKKRLGRDSISNCVMEIADLAVR